MPCVQEVLDPSTEDATQSWGAIIAQHASADLEIVAWTGAEQNPVPGGGPIHPGTPTCPQMFTQLVAGSNSSQPDFSWVPQVRLQSLCRLSAGPNAKL